MPFPNQTAISYKLLPETLVCKTTDGNHGQQWKLSESKNSSLFLSLCINKYIFTHTHTLPRWLLKVEDWKSCAQFYSRFLVSVAPHTHTHTHIILTYKLTSCESSAVNKWKLSLKAAIPVQRTNKYHTHFQKIFICFAYFKHVLTVILCLRFHICSDKIWILNKNYQKII